MPGRALLWVLGAIAALVVMAALTVAASRLSTQEIGLSMEPPGAGATLIAPPPRPGVRARTRPRAGAHPRARHTPAPAGAEEGAGGDD